MLVMQVNRGPLEAYYKAAYAAIRKYSSDCFVVIAPRVYEQDGSAWQHFMTGSGYRNVLQDLHRSASGALPAWWCDSTRTATRHGTVLARMRVLSCCNMVTRACHLFQQDS